jgi:hypothetical protein
MILWREILWPNSAVKKRTVEIRQICLNNLLKAVFQLMDFPPKVRHFSSLARDERETVVELKLACCQSPRKNVVSCE